MLKHRALCVVTRCTGTRTRNRLPLTGTCEIFAFKCLANDHIKLKSILLAAWRKSKPVRISCSCICFLSARLFLMEHNLSGKHSSRKGRWARLRPHAVCLNIQAIHHRGKMGPAEIWWCPQPPPEFECCSVVVTVRTTVEVGENNRSQCFL